MTSKQPDWDDYPVIEGVQPPRVEVWEAVALSLDLDPKSLELDFSFGDDDLLGAFPDEAMERAFLRRLQQAQQNIFDERWFSEVQTSGRSKHFRSVLLPQFAAFALHCGWDCPEQFKQISDAGRIEDPESRREEGLAEQQDRRLRAYEEDFEGRWLEKPGGKYGAAGKHGAKTKLIAREKEEGRGRTDEKTVDADLTAAAVRRDAAKRAGLPATSPFTVHKVKSGKR